MPNHNYKSENIYDEELDEREGEDNKNVGSVKNSPLKLAVTGTGESPDKIKYYEESSLA